MDSNKDEALRCIEVAEKYIKERKKEKAQKFLYKAERLFPTQRAKGKVTDGKLIKDLRVFFVDLLLQVSILPDSVESEEPKIRKPSLPRDASPKKPEYSSEQLALVKKIRLVLI